MSVMIMRGSRIFAISLILNAVVRKQLNLFPLVSYKSKEFSFYFIYLIICFSRGGARGWVYEIFNCLWMTVLP